MDIAVHPATTRRFGPPADWVPDVHGECGTLCVADIVDGGGQPYMESLWRPNEDELASLVAGGTILLGIRGTVHPVVYVGVTAPQHDQVRT